MAEPARPEITLEDTPPVDPSAIDRAYRQHRAKRRAQVERKRQNRLANVRFWIVLLVLLFVSVFLGLTIWHAIQKLFGL
jgi:hypothetical protein